MNSCLRASADAFRYVGDPIDVVTGSSSEVVLDFKLGGPLPLFWRRQHDSLRNGQCYQFGWGHDFEFNRRLQFDLDGIRYVGPLDRAVGFPPLTRDGQTGSSGGLTLRRVDIAQYWLSEHGQPDMEFSFLAGKTTGWLKSLRQGDHRISFRYDSQGALSGVTDSQGRILMLERDASGRMTRVVMQRTGGGDGRTLVQYRYDTAGNLAQATDPYGNNLTYQHDQNNRVIRKTDRRGYSFQLEYDDRGRCTRSRGEDGLQEVNLRYLTAKLVTIVTKADGGQWQYFFDENRTLRQIVDPFGGTRLFVPDASGRISEEANAAGAVTRRLYDEAGALIGKSLPTGILALSAPPPNIAPRHAHRVANCPLEWECGLRLSRREILLPLEDDPALRQLLAEARRAITTVAASVKQFAGSIQRPLPFRSPVPATLITPVYDDLGVLVREELPNGSARRWLYDANGNVQTFTDADGAKRLFEATSWNLLHREINPLGGTTAYRYTQTEQIAEVTDPGGTVSQYTYDLKDRITKVTRHGLVREEYTYDRADNLIAKRNGRGEPLLSYAYAPEGFLLCRELASGESHTFTYDKQGRYLTAGSGGGEVSFAYDLAGNRVKDLREGLGVAHRFDTSRHTLETAFFGRFSVRYRRTGPGIVTLEDPAGGKQRLTFLPNGIAVRAFSNGSSEVQQFDRSGYCLAKVVTRAGDPGRPWSRRYHYSAEGDLLRTEDSLSGNWRYEYDACHRLVRRLRPGGEADGFEFDAAGNLLRQAGLEGVLLQSGNRLHTANGDVFEYDHRSHISRRLNTRQTTNYAYDSRDMLVECTLASGTWRATYDALGRRISKSFREQEYLFYWDSDRLAAEIFPDGRVRIYLYTDRLALTPVMFLEYASMNADPKSACRYFVFSDQIGTPVLIEDDHGTTVWSARIDPFGRVQIGNGSRIEFHLRFPGHYFDSETGLHYNRFRYYSPELGRYLQADPYGIAGGLNVYSYAEGNPLTQVDVRGLACKTHGGDPDPDCEDCKNAEAARQRFQQDFENDPNVFKPDMDPNRADGVQKYQNGEIGNSVRDLNLEGMTPQQIHDQLTQNGWQHNQGTINDFSGQNTDPNAPNYNPNRGQPKTGPDGQPLRQDIYTNPDGGMVRVKPDGDPGSMRPQPHASKSVRNPPDAPITNFDNEACKVDNQGNALPAAPRDMQNPYPPGTPENRQFADGWADTAHTFTE